MYVVEWNESAFANNYVQISQAAIQDNQTVSP